MDIPLSCRCGAVRGVARGVANGIRVVCHCDDCQAYAHALERPDVLDRYGGTDVFQMAPSQLTLSQGSEHVRCLRLSEKGLLRWYAGCCATPMGNTLPAARVPFVGVVHTFMDHAGHGVTRDDALGPPREFIQGRFAVGGVPPHAQARATVSLMARSAWFLLRGFLAGAHRPSPFFDAEGKPVVTPRVLSVAERAALRAPHP